MYFKSHVSHRMNIVVTGLMVAGVAFGCQAKPTPPTDAQIQALVKKTKNDLVFVKGGDFMMGDFGEIHSEEKLPYSFEQDDGPLHQVSVSDFSISKFKVTLAEYDLYAASYNLPLPYVGPKAMAGELRIRKDPQSSLFPVGVDWADAQGLLPMAWKAFESEYGTANRS